MCNNKCIFFYKTCFFAQYVHFLYQLPHRYDMDNHGQRIHEPDTMTNEEYSQSMNEILFQHQVCFIIIYILEEE